ncbi:diadenylate cyclase [Cerasibacillus quisquiliarum]|uniref:Diadenylate cyclase n=1 Tax=Cerasibacillus quisquiliarum TaxID=227865 RepID=A0A511V1M9_9BACI|nr:diadenylate cyclase CdaA [Cerasibacillus quisquiliarum]MBB5146842.1 diadenylate cyclase [Cerasibacillus quisquiliarum]GEN31663.1 cyclic di-AMP synthase CdaA [Cerasibacillus quisquiliarum]
MLDGEFTFIDLLNIVVDIGLVWYVLYKLIMLIRGTKAIQLLKGIVVVIVVRFISIIFGLQTIQWLTKQAIDWGFLLIVILFQPELRRALEQIGRGNIFVRSTRTEEEILNQIIKDIGEACSYMAKRRIGALITIERETGIGEYIETGIPINGKLTHQLLTNIFTPNTPLHDGAVIIRGESIVAAACYLPLSESPLISKELGTRHRAAMGISEVTDALTIIVSEETGQISCAKNGELHRELTEEQLKLILRENLSLHLKSPEKKSWKWRGKKNG